MKRLAAATLAVAALACGGERAPEAGAPTDEPGTAQVVPVPEGANDPMNLEVTVYFPGADGRGLVGEPRSILPTPLPGDRAKQIVQELIAGPKGEGAQHAVPKGTTLRQVYVEDDGVAWIDLSAELTTGIGGGSSQEILAVYSLVDSVGLGVPGITRVGLLVDGHPLETLNGHLDLRRPLPPRHDLVSAAAAKE